MLVFFKALVVFVRNDGHMVTIVTSNTTPNILPRRSPWVAGRKSISERWDAWPLLQASLPMPSWRVTLFGRGGGWLLYFLPRESCQWRSLREGGQVEFGMGLNVLSFSYYRAVGPPSAIELGCKVALGSRFCSRWCKSKEPLVGLSGPGWGLG